MVKEGTESNGNTVQDPLLNQPSQPSPKPPTQIKPKPPPKPLFLSKPDTPGQGVLVLPPHPSRPSSQYPPESPQAPFPRRPDFAHFDAVNKMPRPRPSSGGKDPEAHHDDKPGGLGNCLATLLQAPVLIASGIIVPVFGVVFVVMGILNMNDCTIEPLIPVWMLVQGLIMVCGVGVGGLWTRSLKNGESSSIVTKIISLILSLASLAWFLAGNVWVYRAWAQDPDYAHSWFENGCDMAGFNTAFYGIIVLDALAILSIVVGAVAFILRGCRSR